MSSLNSALSDTFSALKSAIASLSFILTSWIRVSLRISASFTASLSLASLEWMSSLRDWNIVIQPIIKVLTNAMTMLATATVQPAPLPGDKYRWGSTGSGLIFGL